MRHPLNIRRTSAGLAELSRGEEQKSQIGHSVSLGSAGFQFICARVISSRFVAICYSLGNSSAWPSLRLGALVG